MDITTITAALTGAKAAFDLAGSAIATRDEAKLAGAQKLFSDEILKVNLACLELIGKTATAMGEIQKLKDELHQAKSDVAALERAKAKRDQYTLHALSPSVFVLAYDKPNESGQPMHFLCQPCMDNEGKYVVLNLLQTVANTYLFCNVCKTRYFARVGGTGRR